MSIPFYTEERLAQRNKDFQTCFTAEGHKASREIFSVELRRQNRRKHIEHKRAQMLKEHPMPEDLSQYQNIFSGPDEDSVHLLVSLLSQNRSNLQTTIFCLQKLSVISIDTKKIHLIIDNKILPLVLDIANTHDLDVLQKCVWLFINLSTGDVSICEDMVKNGVYDICMWLVRKDIKGISEDALWCISNMIVDNFFACRKIMGSSDFEVVESCIKKNLFPSLDKAYWIIAQLAKYTQTPEEDYKILKLAITGLDFNLDKDINLPAVSALSSITRKNIDLVLQTPHIISTLIGLSSKNYDKLTYASLKVFGNIAYGNVNHTQALLDNQILDFLIKNITSFNKKIKNECLLIIYNLLASEKSQLLQVLSSSDIKYQILESTLHSSINIRLEAWNCANVVMIALSPNENKFHQEAIFYISRSLENETNCEILKMIIGSLENILYNAGEEIQFFKDLIMKSECVNKMERLKNYGNQSIEEMVENVIKYYYDDNEEDKEACEGGGKGQNFIKLGENFTFS